MAITEENDVVDIFELKVGCVHMQSNAFETLKMFNLEIHKFEIRT